MKEASRKKGMAVRKKLWIGIAVLVLLSPLGVIVPSLFGAGGAWGEWGIEEIERIAGYLPEGMKRLVDSWRSPMPDYTVPGQARGLTGESFGYFATAAIGVSLTAAAGWMLAKLLSRRERDGNDNDRPFSSGTPEG